LIIIFINAENVEFLDTALEFLKEPKYTNKRIVYAVYAVDIDNEAIKNTSKRLEKFRNVIVICMDGTEFLEKHNDYTIVFFGGTKNIEKMLKVAYKKAKKIAVNAARVDIAIHVANVMKELGIFKEILLVNIAKSYELAGGLAFKPLNPVFIIFGQNHQN